MAGKVDNLVGLKENVILGHLIPAGTGFRTFQDSEVQYNLEAMREAAMQPTQSLEESFPLLESATSTNPLADSSAAPPAELPNDFLSTMAASGSLGDLGAEAAGDAAMAQASSGLIGGDVSTMADPQSLAGDDFTKIEGVGPKIAELLNAGGITSFAQLSTTPPDLIKSVLVAGGPSYANHDPSTWPDQAMLAASGEWGQLKEWQDQLIGGKQPEGTTAPAAVTPDASGMSSLMAADSAAPVAPVAPADQDDLTKIEGVGPVIGELLGAGGITSFAQLPSTPTDQIQSILNAGGLSSHDPATWPAQAQMAADGKWHELKVWQDELDGGNPVAPSDDLTKIEGIGPKIAEHLAANGITSYALLSQATPAQLSEILASGGYSAHDPGTWPQQSGMAAAGDWDNLKVWQDELDGGKVVSAPDDLTKVEGIGPKVAEILNANGITTFAQLAGTSPEAIGEWLTAAGGMMANMKPGTWPKQAEMAAAGQWDELQVWQDELDGGV